MNSQDTQLVSPVLDFSGGVPAEVQASLAEEARKLIERYGKDMHEAHFAFHVKSPQQKHHVEAHASLVTDRGRYFSATEGWSVDEACGTCMDNLRAQLERQTI